MDVKAFNESIDLIAKNKGISREAVLASLKEAMEASYIKYLKGGDDAMVEATIDEENGHITLCHKKNIVKEVQDDYLEISENDAKEDAELNIEHLVEEIDYLKRARGLEKEEREELKHLLSLVKAEQEKIAIGGKYAMYCPLTELTKLTAMSIKSTLKAKIGEAERVALYDVYKDHIGEMMSGTVEKADEKGATINIGRTTVELGKKDMIGDEFFKVGETVKVYIQEVKAADNPETGATNKGPQIEVTRSSEGFLKRLFEDEIHEIYEGIVIIKGIARIAGTRSKVAVYSIKEDIDPTGACIGQGGSRIQKIVAQLGNSHDKEKIDIIPYSEDPSLYIAESLRPAQVIGVGMKKLEEGEREPTAVAIVKDDQYYIAIGKKSANIRLAKRLTGHNIEIYEETAAAQDGIQFEAIDDIRTRVEDEKRVRDRADYAQRSLRLAEEREALRHIDDEPTEAIAMPELPIEDEDIVEKPVDGTAPALTTPAAAPVEETPAPAVVKEEPNEAPAEEEPEVKVQVKTTTTLDELERDLIISSKQPKKEEYQYPRRFTNKKEDKRPRQISDKEQAHAKPAVAIELPANALPIYTKEEMAESPVVEEEKTSDYYNEEDENLEYEYNDQYDDIK